MALSDTTLVRMCVAIFVVPLLAGLVLIFFGRKLPRGGDWLATLGIASCAAIALTLFFKFIVGVHDPAWHWASAEHGLSWRWLDLGAVQFAPGIWLDNLTVI